MNAKNRNLVESIENAIIDYACKVSFDSAALTVGWNENTVKARTKLQKLLLDLEEALP